MIRKVLIVILFFCFQYVLGQKTLENYIAKAPLYKSYYSPFSYYDNAEKKEGISINNEKAILKRLRFKTLAHGEYYITGKYEINNLLVLFFSQYSDSENRHFAMLFDSSLSIIDRLEETAYSNSEGFYGVNSSIDYNIITIATNNIYNNPEITEKKYTITKNGFKEVKNQVIIKTPSGVRVRENPTTNSAIVTAAPNLKVYDFLSNDYIIDSTSVYDGGKLMKNHWLEIAVDDSLKQTGYVFGAFAKRHIEVITNDFKIVIDEVSEEQFNAKENSEIVESPIEKITDLEKIKEFLKHQLVIENQVEDYYKIIKIITDNGKTFDYFEQHLDECDIAAYYPKYHYLLLECGHSSDYLISLKDGKDDVNRIGNPNYYIVSPKNKFRLNGYYSGQSNIHFLEKNNDEKEPEYLLSISNLIPSDYIEKLFWVDDNTIYLKIEQDYFKMQLVKL